MNARERALHATLKLLSDIERERIAKAFGRPVERPGPPPASESIYWRPKGEKPSEDAEWLKDGWSRR